MNNKNIISIFCAISLTCCKSNADKRQESVSEAAESARELAKDAENLKEKVNKLTESKCANVKNEPGCGDDETPGCVFAVDENDCVYAKKINSRAVEKTSVDKPYCLSYLKQVEELVMYASRYESSVGDSDRGSRGACLTRMRRDFERIESLKEKLNSIENNNLHKLGATKYPMFSAVSYAQNCVTCSSRSSNSISCNDMREALSSAKKIACSK